MMYSSWDTEWNGLNFLPLWAIFCPFIPPSPHPPPHPLTANNAENQNSEKMRKWSGVGIILRMPTSNHDHMMYTYWDMECDRFFLSFLAIFCIFYPSNNLENQNFEKMRKGPTFVVILHSSTKNQDHMMYASWDMECDRQIS